VLPLPLLCRDYSSHRVSTTDPPPRTPREEQDTSRQPLQKPKMRVPSAGDKLPPPSGTVSRLRHPYLWGTRPWPCKPRCPGDRLPRLSLIAELVPLGFSTFNVWSTACCFLSGVFTRAAYSKEVFIAGTLATRGLPRGTAFLL